MNRLLAQQQFREQRVIASRSEAAVSILAAKSSNTALACSGELTAPPAPISEIALCSVVVTSLTWST